jgi:hypothetical protein
LSDTLELQNQNRQLKQTTAALRDEMEAANIKKHEAVQQVVVASNNELTPLRETIVSLRDRLELQS